VATGVIGMRLADSEDEVVGMVCVNDPENETIMVVSENGYGKRSVVEDYRLTKRGSKGVITLNITDKTGELVAVKCVTGDEDLMIINKSGIAIRFAIADAGDTKGRNTQGVKLIELKKRNEAIASVCVVPHEEEEEDNDNDNVNESPNDQTTN
ncbi:MAG: DNA gyrase subunit A, partial [Prevotella sp.]|nr:DNA gyrase subunit A [Prevotella sp.]